jgi:hypothetical protein
MASRKHWAARPHASRYTADMSKHSFLGTDSSLKQEYRDYAPQL